MRDRVPRVVVTNDDGARAPGLETLTRALVAAGLDVVVIAPATNQGGVSRAATYATPVRLEQIDSFDGAPVLACFGSPVDCVRAGLLGEVSKSAELVVSGINHGANLGDDILSSGTVGAAIEGALLGARALAVSQQSHVGHFHILDALDQTTPVYEETAHIAALFALAMLRQPGPERSVLNVNFPAELIGFGVAVTRLGRRFYPRGSAVAAGLDGDSAYLTYGRREGPTPEFESSPGTDFGAIAAGRVSVTPLSYAWHKRDQDLVACTRWATDVAADARRMWSRVAGIPFTRDETTSGGP
jgi:5'-nucleotidase